MKKIFKLLITKIFVRQNNRIISKYKPAIIVVVGSIGKTSTKLAIASVLSKKYKVQYENGNYKVPISVPFVLTGQRLPSLTSLSGWIKAYKKGQSILKNGFNFDVVVLEYSIDHINEMDDFRVFPNADYLVISAIAPEHMENLIDIDTVAKEELKATKYSNNIIFNANTVKQKYIDRYADSRSSYESYGESKSCNYIQEKSKLHGRYKLDLKDSNGGFFISSKTNLIAPHSLDALSAAAIIANKLGMSNKDIEEAVSTFNNPSGRMSILEGKNKSLIIDDSYNSSPEAVIAALKALYSLEQKHKIAILGNMNELGAYSKEAHIQIGEYCNPKFLDLLITIGTDANQYTAMAAEKNGCKVYKATSPVEAGQIALEHLAQNSAVLVKGSQNKVFAEESVKPLLNNPAQSSLLVRQSNYWMQIKRRQFSDVS